MLCIYKKKYAISNLFYINFKWIPRKCGAYKINCYLYKKKNRITNMYSMCDLYESPRRAHRTYQSKNFVWSSTLDGWRSSLGMVMLKTTLQRRLLPLLSARLSRLLFECIIIIITIMMVSDLFEWELNAKNTNNNIETRTQKSKMYVCM